MNINGISSFAHSLICSQLCYMIKLSFWLSCLARYQPSSFSPCMQSSSPRTKIALLTLDTFHVLTWRVLNAVKYIFQSLNVPAQHDKSTFSLFRCNFYIADLNKQDCHFFLNFVSLFCKISLLFERKIKSKFFNINALIRKIY